MSGKGEADDTKRNDQGSLRSSVSDSSLVYLPPAAEEPQAASPQSFAALKQAFDFVLPQFKTLQAEHRIALKENEELRKKLSESEALSIEMPNHRSRELPDGLRAKGQSSRTLVAPIIDEQVDERSNGEQYRVSPCGGVDSAINLNDGVSLTAEKGVQEERLKWQLFAFKLLLYFPTEMLTQLTGLPEHCLVNLGEFIQRSEDQGSVLVGRKLETLKKVNDFRSGQSLTRTSGLAGPEGVGTEMGLTVYGDVAEAVRGSPMGKSLPMSSDEDPSDEDIYTSGFPTRGKGRTSSSPGGDDGGEHEWVRVDNAVDILEKCANYIHQSLEVHSILKKKLDEERKNTELGRSKSFDYVGRTPSAASPSPTLPHLPLPSRAIPSVIPAPQSRPFDRRLDHLRQSFPSSASDPGKASSAMSQLTLEKLYFSDPSASGDPRNKSPRKSGRPKSVADVPLQEMSVKYPPLPYLSRRSIHSQEQPSPPDFGHQSPVTIDHNNFQFDDGQTYQPCGPPEVDTRKYEPQREDGEDDFLSWNAARNPDLFQLAPEPVRFSRSDPSKRYVPSGSSGGIVGDGYGIRPQLPRSSDRIYDMDTSERFGPETLTNTGYSTGDLGRFGAAPQADKLPMEGPVCPVCDKKFVPGTADVAVNSHVNLHFENERNHFEIIEK